MRCLVNCITCSLFGACMGVRANLSLLSRMVFTDFVVVSILLSESESDSLSESLSDSESSESSGSSGSAGLLMTVTAVTLVVIPAVLLAAVLLLVLVPMVSDSTLNWFGVAITLGVVSAATIVAVLCGVVQAVVGIQFIVLVSKSSRTIKTKAIAIYAIRVDRVLSSNLILIGSEESST